MPHGIIASVRSQRWMVVVWACFLARLLFYCAMLPLWEGYDEWAHFAVIRHMVSHGQLLAPRDAPVPHDVEASFQLAPVPWEMRALPPPSYTRDAYWRLSPQERARREQALYTMRNTEDSAGAFTAYEALQPPLYYWLVAPAMWICRSFGAELLAQVLTLRLLSALIASLVIPLVFFLGREVWHDDRLAVGCAAIVALMPGLALDVARVGNDCLAVVLFTALTWLLVRSVERRLEVSVGVVLGFGLLSKAYFLTALPLVIVVSAYDWRRSRSSRRAVLVVSTALLLSGWWYLRNLRTTGTLSGLSESVMLRRTGAGEMVRRAAEIPWGKAIDSIVFSHLYFGGWSSLTVRSWMYHVFYALILAAAVGLLRTLKLPAILTLLLVYASFWSGQLYNIVLLYVSKGLAGSMGWYMYAVVGAEVTLSVAGLRKLLPARTAGWVTGGGAILFALLDLYTVHGVAIPYYTGMIQHRANGTLEALHWGGVQAVGIGTAIARLATFVPGPALVAAWLLYLLATAGALAGACARKCDSAANRQG